MEKIRPKKVLFIKLGRAGKFEKECIEQTNTIRLGYNEVDHEFCINREWERVFDFFTNELKTKAFVASSHTNQIKQFYEEDENTLWITFFLNKLWWCFSKQEISLLPDGTKTRPVFGQWSDKDLHGETLLNSNLSGKLLKTQGFRGTICSVPEENYAITKINGEQLTEVVEVEKAMNDLKAKLTLLIQNLQWKDFETLIDLIFRQAGWQRVGDTGKTQKTLDLELLAPVTGERGIVQIKSESSLNEFLNYQNTFASMNEYNKFFFVVNKATPDLINYEDDSDTILYFGDKIAELTISSGLVDWVIKKTS